MITATQLIKEWGLWITNYTSVGDNESLVTSTVITKTDSTKRFNLKVIHSNAALSQDNIINTILYKAQGEPDLAKAFNEFIGNEVVNDVNINDTCVFNIEIEEWSYTSINYNDDYDSYD